MNVPLKDGMTDEAYTFLFRPVMRRVMEIYQPEVIVFQSGAALPALSRRWAEVLAFVITRQCWRHRSDMYRTFHKARLSAGLGSCWKPKRKLAQVRTRWQGTG